MSTPESPLHDPGSLHDPFLSDTFLLNSIKETVNPAVVGNKPAAVGNNPAVKPAKRKKNKKAAPAKCKVRGCYEGINLRARNDTKYTLCESHKRARVAHCDDGKDVCFCFYCNKVHSINLFTHKTNICDKQYLRRRMKISEKRESSTLSDCWKF